MMASHLITLWPAQGRKLDQKGVEELATNENLLLICGRYEGVDERIIQSASWLAIRHPSSQNHQSTILRRLLIE